MPLGSRASSLLRNLWRRQRAERDLDDEVRAYLDMLVDEKRAAGLPEESARRAALIELQGVEQVKERVREIRAGALAEQLWKDALDGSRALARQPAFTVAAVATLALGIGANTAVFSVVDTIVWRPLPYSDGARLVKICGNARGEPTDDVSLPDFVDIRDQNHSFASIAADDGTAFVVQHGASREHVLGAFVTAGWLSTLGVTPALGRAFLPEEAQPGRDRVVLLTDDYWRRRFAADPHVVGTSLSIDGRSFTVIGVLPPNVLRYAADFLRPLVPAEYPSERGHRDLDVFARLRRGVTLTQAQADLATIARRLEREYPGTNTGRRLTAIPLGKYYAAVNPGAQSGLLLTLGAVALVLLIACVNVTSLLLARGIARGREYVLRAALGASRGRLVRQLLTETLLLFVAGGVLGLAIAAGCVDWLRALAVTGGYVPERVTVSVDARLFAFSLIVAILCGAAVGIGPALQASNVDLNEGLRDAGHAASGGARRTRTRRVLIVSELALSVLLLAGFGLLMRSYRHVQSNAAELAADRILETSAEGGRSFSSAVAFWTRALEHARAAAGVEAAAVTSRPPIHGARDQRFAVWGRREATAQPEPRAGDILVSADYFRTMGIRIVKGRAFTDRDDAAAPPVVIVSRRLASRYFRGMDPIGQRVSIAETDPMTCCSAAGGVAGVWREIVGVAEDVRQANLDESPAATLYRPYSQIVEHDMYLMARVSAAGDVGRAAADLQSRLQAAAPGTEWPTVVTLQRVIDESGSIRLRRFMLVLFGTFAALALTLAGVGLYAVMSYSVAERRREIGIRVALGATRGMVLGHVLAEAIRLAVIALLLGAIAAPLLSRLIGSMLYGVRSTDALTYLGVWALLAAVTVIASYVPARRATRVDPILALREP